MSDFAISHGFQTIPTDSETFYRKYVVSPNQIFAHTNIHPGQVRLQPLSAGSNYHLNRVQPHTYKGHSCSSTY